jgi:hypothetical protein
LAISFVGCIGAHPTDKAVLNNLNWKYKFMESEYSNYIDFKKWTFGELSDDLRESYTQEMACCQLKSGSQIFEMGFGQGSFLKWSKEQNFGSFGTEINSDLIQLAQKNGYNVCHSSENIKEKIAGQKFNAVVAFDVLEHLTKNEIIDFFQFAKEILLNEGYVVVRFPNGQSPFGRYYQYGDPTHVSVLSRVIIEQLALRVGFKVQITKNSSRPLGQSLLKKIKRGFIYKLRDCIGTLVCLIFWGEVYPMDPNITMILTKSEQQKQSANVPLPFTYHLKSPSNCKKILINNRTSCLNP